MNNLLFDDTEYLPLLSGCVVPVIEKEPKPRVIVQEQMLLCSIECHCCMDTGKIMVGKEERRCWCSAGQERQ